MFPLHLSGQVGKNQLDYLQTNGEKLTVGIFHNLIFWSP